MTALHTLARALVLATPVWLLTACSPERESTSAINARQTTTITQSATEHAPITGPTVNSLMTDTINPAARNLWNAVSYVVNAEGTQETSPQTDDDWNRLRRDAETLLQAAVVLKMPGLRVNTDPALARPDFQFTPAEIEAAWADNPLPWRRHAQDMEASTLQILGSIERRDLDAYLQLGVDLNRSCEGCHGEYWYKPQPMRGAEGIR